jgi:hypothetical protein
MLDRDWMYGIKYAVQDFSMNISVKIRNPTFLSNNSKFCKKRYKSGITNQKQFCRRWKFTYALNTDKIPSSVIGSSIVSVSEHQAIWKTKS